jgi:hypothetical protein
LKVYSAKRKVKLIALLLHSAHMYIGFDVRSQ